jgi:hypothetical protein
MNQNLNTEKRSRPRGSGDRKDIYGVNFTSMQMQEEKRKAGENDEESRNFCFLSMAQGELRFC